MLTAVLSQCLGQLKWPRFHHCGLDHVRSRIRGGRRARKLAGHVLICGGATIACGIVFLLLMPASPETAWSLTEEERKIARHRLLSDGFVSDEKVFQKSQVWEALTGPLCWAAILFAFPGTFASPLLKGCRLLYIYWQ